ncbi:MAG TPA: CHASE2 domain-containing protein [Solirubrobacter sp.]
MSRSSARGLAMGSTPPEHRHQRPSPFPGLRPYGEADADLYFGRRAERDLALANLLTSRVTVMYGPSGAGKSSLLRAGVLPRLRDGVGVPTGGSSRVVVLVDAWQGDPVRAILGGVAAAAGEAETGEVSFEEGLSRYGQRLGGILLLILDQFEEYFLYHEGREDRLRNDLLPALARTDVRVRALICIREDALAKLDALEGPAAALFGNLLRLQPMSDAAALEAITQPVERDPRVTLEPGLPEHVLRVLHEPEPSAGAARGVRGGSAGIEPSYLQLVMRRLWDREMTRGSSVLRIETLTSLGGLRQIVSEHLSEAMDRLTPAERRRMAEAFHYLVTPSGAKIAQRRYDLAQLTGVREDELAVALEKLAAGDARILRPVDDSSSYEIFHDVLAQPLLDWQARFHAARLQRRAAVLGFVAAASVAIVLALVAYVLKPAGLDRAELMTVDARFALRGDVPAERDIVIVDLDDASLAALGGGDDRIPRTLHARMIDTLRAAGAAVIAYDIEFRERGPADASLRRAIERAGPRLVLAATLIDSDGQGQILGRPGGELAANVGYAGLPLAADGAYRQVDESVGLSGGDHAEPGSQRLESFAVVASRLAGTPPAHFGRAWIDYHGPAGTYRSAAFADVLRGSDPRRFANKVVVVGTSAHKQADLHPTARDGGRVMSGAEIQANAISTLRRGRPLRSPATAADLALVVALGLLPAMFVIAAGPKLAGGLMAVAAVVYLALAQIVFSPGWVLPVAYPLLSLLVSALGVFAARRLIAGPRRSRPWRPRG